MIEKFLLASSCGNFAGTCWYGDAKITLERKGFYFYYILLAENLKLQIWLYPSKWWFKDCCFIVSLVYGFHTFPQMLHFLDKQLLSGCGSYSILTIMGLKVAMLLLEKLDLQSQIKIVCKDHLKFNDGAFWSRPVNVPGLDGNKLVQVWNIARNFHLSPFRRVVNSTLESERMSLDVRSENRISEGLRLNTTHINCTLTIF